MPSPAVTPIDRDHAASSACPIGHDLVAALLSRAPSIRAVARELHIDHTVLARVSTGQSKLGLKACLSIARTYPTLRRCAAAYLAHRYNPDELALLAEAHQITQDRRLTR